MDVDVERAGAAVHLRLAGPQKKKNAITVAMYEALAAALEEASQDPTVRVVTLSGTGGVFTAGNDLADFSCLTTG